MQYVASHCHDREPIAHAPVFRKYSSHVFQLPQDITVEKYRQTRKNELHMDNCFSVKERDEHGLHFICQAFLGQDDDKILPLRRLLCKSKIASINPTFITSNNLCFQTFLQDLCKSECNAIFVHCSPNVVAIHLMFNL